MILQKARTRKLEYTDKLGRKWKWDRVRKKYIYIRKGTKKVVPPTRNRDMIEFAKQGKTTKQVAQKFGLSTARTRSILKRAVKEGKLKSITSGKRVAKKKVNLKEAFSFTTRKRLKGKTEKVADGTAEHQPYEKTGIIVGRSKITRLPSRDYMSADLKSVLRKHQSDAINLFMQKYDEGYKNVNNFDGTGAGKTMQEIGLGETYLEHAPNSKVLIVTENDRIMVDSFAKDTKRLGVKMTPVKKPGDLQGKGPGIYITTYRDLQNLADSFDDIDLSIFDEAHNMKNATISTKAKVGIELINKSKHTAMFTATPVDKAQHLAYICQAHDLSFKKVMKFLGFQRKGNHYYTNLSYAEITLRYDAMFRELTKKGLIVKREVPLDGMTMQIETVKLSDEYKSRYNAAVEKMNKQLQVATKKRRGLMKAQWLMKIRALLEEAKLEKTVDKIGEAIKQGKQVVLFAARVRGSVLKMKELGREHFIKFTEGTLTKLGEMLKKKGISYAEVFGGKKEAADDIKAFQSGTKQVLITTPQSGGTGISLDDVTGKKPRLAIVMTPPFSAVDFIQMPGRVHRLTTKSKSEVVLMSTDTPVEEWNKNIIANKLVTLGASVKGEYAALSIEDLEKTENMPPKEAANYLAEQKKKAQSVPASSPYTFNMEDFKGAETAAKAIQLAIEIEKLEKGKKRPIGFVTAGGYKKTAKGWVKVKKEQGKKQAAKKKIWYKTDKQGRKVKYEEYKGYIIKKDYKVGRNVVTWIVEDKQGNYIERLKNRGQCAYYIDYLVGRKDKLESFSEWEERTAQ